MLLQKVKKLLHYKRGLFSTISQLNTNKNSGQLFILNNITKKVWSNSVGYHRLRRWNLELRVPIKMNTIGGDVLQATIINRFI
jgi:hypothetical protein